MILVTGGTGLVGAHLLLKLILKKEKVRAIHRSENFEDVKNIFSYYEPKKYLELFDQVKWVKADILDIPALADAFRGAEYVYHCAAIVNFDASEAKLMRKINIEGTANVVNLALSFKIKKLCHVSSIATLDKDLGETEITETSNWNPAIHHSGYAISKYGAEMEVWRAMQEGLSAVIVNPGVIIGSGKWNTGSGRVFSKIDKGLNLYLPKQTGFVGVNDVVKTMTKLMDSSIENEQFILVAENLSFQRIFELVAAELDKPIPKRALKPWMIKLAWIYQSFGSLFGNKKELHKQSAKTLFISETYNNKKIKEELSFEFEPIQNVVAQTADFFKKDKIKLS